MKAQKELLRLIKFAERAKGLETREKIKLVLFLKKTKPNAEVILKSIGKEIAGIIDEQKEPNKTIINLADEKEIPYVVSIENATEIIETGDSVTIDGHLGFITLHKVK